MWGAGVGYGHKWVFLPGGPPQPAAACPAFALKPPTPTPTPCLRPAQLLEVGERLIKAGVLYADDTPVEQMREERLARTESRCRGRSVAENLEAWEEMKKGSEQGTAYAMRFKMDMKVGGHGCLGGVRAGQQAVPWARALCLLWAAFGNGAHSTNHFRAAWLSLLPPP